MPEDIIVTVIYACPICKQDGFGSPEKAVQCRDSHVVPVEIVKADFAYKKPVPMRITVRFPNGFEWTYVVQYQDNFYAEYEQYGK